MGFHHVISVDNLIMLVNERADMDESYSSSDFLCKCGKKTENLEVGITRK